ncbi:hypothetical protein QJS04_geneDACA003474 [Acorus gramineus]|uniref:Glutathione S-transferase n=1 Tax=Acorus gramineus TaxID=55184 RepID=A0AAV9BSG1_ACOGR|nr:hypothetical protein QJS04_geneDACA003474 [Acorus gramineus]
MQDTDMENGKVMLIGTRMSPPVRIIEWGLKWKGVEYEYVEEDLFNKSQLLLKHNPVYQKVPVLVHNGKAIAESVIILEYIDETWKERPFMPNDPYKRAMARFWAGYVSTEMEAFSKVFCGEGEEMKKGLKLAQEALTNLDIEVEGKLFFGGDEAGFVDLVAGWMTHWLSVVEEVKKVKVVDPQKFPSLIAWMEKIVQVPLIKENLPPRDEMLKFYPEFFSKAAALIATRTKLGGAQEEANPLPNN